MRRVLADMAVEVEAATALAMRLARSFDLAANDAQEAARARLLTPAVKFWICKRAPVLICEAMECLGGNGYVEESLLPRVYREAPVNAIWEGSGNIMALDVLRVCLLMIARRRALSLPPSLPERAICRHAVRLLAISKLVSAKLGQSGKPALWSSAWHS